MKGVVFMPKRLTLFAGHYGSGKTNIAVNYAIHLKNMGLPTVIADLDIVNPYFRTKDSEAELKENGIELLCSPYAGSNLDIPALPQEMYRAVQDKNTYAVMDIGGDDRGAYALGRFTPYIKEENNFSAVFVANCYRPLTRTVSDTVEIMREIEAASGISFTCIVNNSNLGEETTAAVVYDSFGYIDELCRVSGLPLWMHTAEKKIAKELTGVPVLPLELQKKYF